VKIGFIGPRPHGNRAMARRLLAAGHELTVNNRSVEKTKPLARRGRPHCANARRSCSLGRGWSSRCSPTTPARRIGRVARNGRRRGSSSGANIHLSMSTISPEMSSRVASTHRDVGQLYIAAAGARPSRCRGARESSPSSPPVRATPSNAAVPSSTRWAGKMHVHRGGAAAGECRQACREFFVRP